SEGEATRSSLEWTRLNAAGYKIAVNLLFFVHSHVRARQHLIRIHPEVSLVDDAGANSEFGHAVAKVLREFLLFEFAEIKEHLQWQCRIGSKTLCMDLAERLTRN